MIYCVAGEDIKKGNLVAFKDNQVFNLSSVEDNATLTEEQLVDELCEYVDLSYMENVLDIIKDVVEFTETRVAKETRQQIKQEEETKIREKNLKMFSEAIVIKKNKRKKK